MKPRRVGVTAPAVLEAARLAKQMGADVVVGQLAGIARRDRKQVDDLRDGAIDVEFREVKEQKQLPEKT